MRIAIVVAAIVALRVNALAAPTAEDRFNEGQDAYDHGDYRRAIDRWQESYRLSKEPALLFNIGQAYRLAGDCLDALSTYKRFIVLDPTSEQRPLADELVRGLEAKCGPTVPNVDRVTPQIESSDTERNLKLAGLVTGGGGVVLVATGLLFGRRASTLADEVSRACSISCDWAEQRSRDSDGRRDAAIGYALDAVGVAAIVGGAVMYYIGDRERRVTVSLRSRESGAVVSWSESW